MLRRWYPPTASPWRYLRPTHETDRPKFDPHGNGIRIGEADTAAPQDQDAADAVDDLLSAAAPARAAQHAPSLLGALSLPHHAPHRVLICWREGCGRHSSRQSGNP